MGKKPRDIIRAVLGGGIIAATIDVGAASIISGRGPDFILHAIAGGLLAKASFEGGVATMVLGAVLQEVMGILIAAIFILMSKRLPVLRRRWLPSGLTYGLGIFFVMNYVVMPLSAWKSMPHFTPVKFAENMAAMLLFGLIVAFFCRNVPMSSALREDAAATPA